jgi:UDP-N-acetylmuramate--alanine ligase
LNIENIHNVYFIGIGGIGMSAIANYFKCNGKNVAGYDRISTNITNSLQENGMNIHFNDSINLIPDEFKNNKQSLIVYTPAIPRDHAELRYFSENNFIILKRAEVLGEITKDTFCFAVAGTHGKTTTSTILGHILKDSGVDATSFLGGISENYNSNLIFGGKDISVVEADEYDRSFLKLSPNIACITSMDADHLDIYGDQRALETSFIAFSDKVSDTLIVKKGLRIKGKTFGLEAKADYDAKNLKIEDGAYIFDVKTPSDYIENIKINLPGKHNVLNTVAALAMANTYGVPLQTIAKALLTFKGIKRRFTYVLKTENIVLIDDYAHHPTEINAVVDSVQEMYPTKKVLGIFQPHLFSRTKDFVNDFANSLARFDELILLDIYPARELPIEGISSHWLLDKISIKNKMVSSKENLVENVLKSKAEIIVMIGAGDIGELVEIIKKRLIVEN